MLSKHSSGIGVRSPGEVAGGDALFTNVCSGSVASLTLVPDLCCRWAEWGCSWLYVGPIASSPYRSPRCSCVRASRSQSNGGCDRWRSPAIGWGVSHWMHVAVSRLE